MKKKTFKLKVDSILHLSAVYFLLRLPGPGVWPISAVDLAAEGVEISTGISVLNVIRV